MIVIQEYLVCDMNNFAINRAAIESKDRTSYVRFPYPELIFFYI